MTNIEPKTDRDVFDAFDEIHASVDRCRTILELTDHWMNDHASGASEVDAKWLYAEEALKRHLDEIDAAIDLALKAATVEVLTRDADGFTAVVRPAG